KAAVFSRLLGRFVSVGTRGGVFVSRSGSTWTRVAPDGTFQQTGEPEGCLIESERLGLLIYIDEDGIRTSPNGAVWTMRDVNDYTRGIAVDSLGMVIAVRDAGSGLTAARIRVSQDAVTWVDAQVPLNTPTWRDVAAKQIVRTSTTPQKPTPAITSLDPSSAEAGADAFTLTVHGTNFLPGTHVDASVVRWDGSDRATTYISDTELQAAILATDVESEGTASVTVANGSRVSDPAVFTIAGEIDPNFS